VLQREFAAIAAAAAPSIVTVRTYARNTANAASNAPTTGWEGATVNQDYFGYRLASAGSGFVVDASGEILTCAHVVLTKEAALPDLVDVETSDGARILCEVIGTEPTVNLAMLRCVVYPAGHPGKLVPLRMGDSDALKRGQWVFGLGDPAGAEAYFGVGNFIAVPTRECYQDQLSAFYMQCALVAPPQAYGGPLLDLNGDVVGILAPRDATPGNDGAQPRYGVEFALPTKIVSGLYATIRQVHSFVSPWLGFSVMSRAEIAAAKGVDAFNAMTKPANGILLETVFRPSPASEVDLRPGDFLVRFGDYKVFSPVDFQRYLYLAGVGTHVTLDIFRDGQTLKKELVVQRRPPEALPR